MANTSMIKGMFPIKPTRGDVVIHYYRASTDTPIYLHSPMVIDSDGKVGAAVTNSGNAILGSAECFLDLNLGAPKESQPYLPAQTEAMVGIADDPDQLYMMEEDTGGSALALTNVGNLLSFCFQASSGNTTTGLSTAVLDRSGVNASSGQLLLRSLMYSADGDNAYGNYAKWIVSINEKFTQITTGFQASGI